MKSGRNVCKLLLEILLINFISFFIAGWIACWFYLCMKLTSGSHLFTSVYKSDNIPGIESHYYYEEEDLETRSNGSTILKLIKSMSLCTFVGLITTIGI